MSRLQLERSGPIATLWLDRADKRNALDAQMMQELAAALDDVGADKKVRVVVIRGRGLAFSSGIDHSLLASHSPTALGLAKVLVQASGDSNSATSFRLEGAFQQTLIGQPDLAQRFPAALAFIKAQMANPE